MSRWLRVWLLVLLFFFFGLSGAVSAEEGGEREGLLIVAPEAFCDALRPFVLFKGSRRPCQLVTLESILDGESGVDEPERLKRHLFRAWKNEGVGYALLVGDGDRLPIRYSTTDRSHKAAHNVAFYPSDLYYADLLDADGRFETWNQRSEGRHKHYFGEIRGETHKKGPINYDRVHYLPELAVGRWPASTVAEVRTLVRKTMRFERSIVEGTHPGGRRVGFCAASGWVDARGLLDRLASGFSDWDVQKLYYGKKKPTPKRLLRLLNEGSLFVCHSGHGTGRSWHGCLDKKHLKKLKNGDRLPILFSVGCSTGRFAPCPPYEAYLDRHGTKHRGTNSGQVFTEPPPYPAALQPRDPSGFGKQTLVGGPGGAVAYIGCSTGSQPCSLTLLEGFTKGWKGQAAPTLGRAWVAAVKHYHRARKLSQLVPTKSWYPPSIYHQAMKFMLFGDPSLPLVPVSER